MESVGWTMEVGKTGLWNSMSQKRDMVHPAGFPTGFREFVLIHENVHRTTGWGDYPNQNSLAVNGNDFETKFFSSGYKNQTTDTGKFTDWLTLGCPP